MEGTTFAKRFELKYRLNRAQRDALCLAMRGHLELDCFGHKTVRNLYCDTANFRLARRSIEKPLYKEKLRIRAYERAAADTPVFIEIKKKFDSVVYKRRITLPCREYLRAVETRQMPEGQVAREIEALLRFYGPTLQPRVLLTYEREAYEPVDGVDFRLTLDQNILWRDTDVDLSAGIHGARLIPEDEFLLEIKTPGGIPLWMVRFLSEHGVYQTSFSKYGAAYAQMAAAGQKEVLLYA